MSGLGLAFGLALGLALGLSLGLALGLQLRLRLGSRVRLGVYLLCLLCFCQACCCQHLGGKIDIANNLS